MTIRQQGGVFGRNPTFNDLTIEGDFNGKHIDLNDALPYLNFNSTDVSGTPRGLAIKINGTEIASIRTNPSTGDLQIVSGFSGWGGKTSFYTNGNLAGQFDSAGNLAFPAGQGIDFSATSGTGTSELFDDYEEGTWTPTDNSGAGLTLSASGFYTKFGRQVTLMFSITYPSNSDASAAIIANLPFAAGDGNLMSGGYTTFKTYTSDIRLFSAGTNLEIYNGAASQVANSALSGHNLRGVVTYFV